MKAAQIHQYGKPDVFRIEDCAEPFPRKGELKIKVHASSVNPVDWKVRSGSISFLSGKKFPKILGADFSGMVVECGPETEGYAIGDEVYGFSSAISTAAAYAEFMCCSVKRLASKPNRLDFIHAAVIPLAASTAYQALYNQGKMKPGMHVLVTGATGGVGHFAVQLAKAAGCRVTGVCHSRNTQLAMSFGCDEVLPYDKIDFRTEKSAYNIIFDAAAKYSYFSCRKLLKPSGVFVSTIPMFSVLVMHALSAISPGKKGRFVGVAGSSGDLETLASLCDSGALVPHVERVFTLDEIAKAHALSETEAVRGKIAIRVI